MRLAFQCTTSDAFALHIRQIRLTHTKHPVTLIGGGVLFLCPALRRFFPLELFFDCFADECRHTVGADQSLNTAAMFDREANLGFLHMQRRATHTSATIRPRKVCQISPP